MNSNQMKQANTTSNNSFNQLMHDYQSTISEKNPCGDSELLNQFSQAVALAVLKKIYNASNNQYVKELQAGVIQSKNNLNRLKKLEEETYKLSYDNDGNTIEKINYDTISEYIKLIDTTISEGYEIVQGATIAILTAVHYQREREYNQSVDLERKYETKRLDKRVVINDEKSAGYKTIETTPIQEIFKQVRSYIDSNRSITIDTSGYSYTELYEDPETEETVYKRLPKNSDFGSYSSKGLDFYGNSIDGLYTVNSEVYDEYTSIIEKLNLTKTQATVLRLMEQGGERAIATYTGLSRNTVHSAIREIRRKVKEYFSHCEDPEKQELIRKYIEDIEFTEK